MRFLLSRLCSAFRPLSPHLSRSASSSTTTSITLRPYQESCVASCLSALSPGTGTTRIGVSSPTGSGKTTIFLALISRLPPPVDRPHAKRALVIVNSVELAQQAAKAAEEMLGTGVSVEIEQGKNVATGGADITIATYQTLLKGFRLNKFDPSMLKAVVVDEAHHAAAPSYRQILSYFDPAIAERVFAPDEDSDPSTAPAHPEPDELPPQMPGDGVVVPIIGFSATFSRHDGLALGKVFQRIVYHRDFLSMIKEQWLCDVRFTSVKAKLDLKDVTISSQTGDFTPTALAHVINTPAINELILRTWLDLASRRKSTLIFCVNVAHVQDVTNAFRRAGVDARLVHGSTPAKARKQLLDDFRAGKFPVLVNCAILIEGADVPNIDCVILAKPTRSRNIFAQMIGRGMRLSPKTEKTDCHIIDFVDSTSRVQGVVTIPTLFGLDPDDVGQDETLEQIEARALRGTEQNSDDEPSSSVSVRETYNTIPAPKSVTYTDYDNPFELAAEGSGSPAIHRLSRYAWVACGPGTYVLECLGRGYIRIEGMSLADMGFGIGEEEEETEEGEDRRGYVAYYTPANMDIDEAKARKKSPYRRKVRILTAESLNAAVKGCDTYAAQNVLYGPMALGLFRSAKWRSDPATDGQKSFLGKRLGKAVENLSELDAESAEAVRAKGEEMERMTKGQAANIITRLKHGAQGHYEKKIGSQARIVARTTKEMEKEAKRVAKHTVTVGPLKA